MKRFSAADLFILLLIVGLLAVICLPALASYNHTKDAEIKTALVENFAADGTSRIEVKDSWPFGFDSREWDSKNIIKRIKNLNFDNIEKISTEKDGDKIEVVVHFKNRQ